MPADPVIDDRALVGIGRPACRDQPDFPGRVEPQPTAGVKYRIIHGIWYHGRLFELESQITMLLQAVMRLEHGHVREFLIQSPYLTVHRDVGAPIHANWAINAVHDAAGGPPRAAQLPRLKVERVAEACARRAGNRVVLNPESAAGNLSP